MIHQLTFQGEGWAEEYTCPLCGQVASLFGQYSPLMPWGVCKRCSIKYPYPYELFVPSTRRNADQEPLMIDPSPQKSDLRARRVELEEMLRCALDPSRLERPVVKYNLSGLELRNPVRRSRMQQFNAMGMKAREALRVRQISLPTCERCGCAHARWYEMLAGIGDYWSHCQRCADELAVEALWRHRALFGNDDVESVMDRVYRSHKDLFERGVLPDYWFTLMMSDTAGGEQ